MGLGGSSPQARQPSAAVFVANYELGSEGGGEAAPTSPDAGIEALLANAAPPTHAPVDRSSSSEFRGGLLTVGDFSSSAVAEGPTVDHSLLAQCLLTQITGSVDDLAGDPEEVLALGTSPITPGTLAFSGMLLNAATGAFNRVRILADSGSEANIVTPNYYADPQPCLPIFIRGIDSAEGEVPSSVSEHGFATLRIGEGNSAQDVRFPVVKRDSISQGSVQLLLSAACSRALGLLSGHLSDSSTQINDLRTVTSSSSSVAPEILNSIPVSTSFPAALALLGTAFTVPLDRQPISRLSFMERIADFCSPADQGSASPSSSSTSSSGGAAMVIPSSQVASVHVTDANIGRIIQARGGNFFPSSDATVDDIIIAVDASQAAIEASGLPGLESGGSLSLGQARILRALFSEMKDAFTANKVPKINNASPVVVDLIPDEPGRRFPSKPHRVPPPTWAPNTRVYLNALRANWVQWGVAVANPHGRWASRIHIVGKGSAADNGDYKDVRPTTDVRGVNTRSTKFACAFPDGPEQVELASRPTRFAFGTDVASAFTGFPVHPDSQEYFSVWLPLGPGAQDGVGLFKITRMVFGFTNAPAIMVAYYDRMKAELQPRTRDRLANFYDDFRLISPNLDDSRKDFKAFAKSLRDFLGRCIDFGLELSISKSAVGRRESEFYGVTVSLDGGCRLSESNLEAVRNLQYPTSRKELRSVLGFMTQLRKFVESYSSLAQPLHKLTSTKVVFKFGDAEKTAFEALRSKVLSTTANYSVDFGQPLILETDASDYAVGARLFQHIDGVDYNIGFFSRSLTVSEQALPVYFRECVGVLYGIHRARLYALSSPFELEVRTDHQSLKFLQDHRGRGALSPYLLAAVQDVRFRIVWVRGADNPYADFLSRYQLESARQLSGKGTLAALESLLSSLGNQHKDSRKLWCYAGPFTTDFARVVQRWRRPANKISVQRPSVATLATAHDFVIVAPKATVAPGLCAKLLLARRPFACLLPLDLLHVVSVRHDGKFDPVVRKLLGHSSRVAYPLANFIWIVGGVVFPDAIVMPVSAAPSQGFPADAGQPAAGAGEAAPQGPTAASTQSLLLPPQGDSHGGGSEPVSSSDGRAAARAMSVKLLRQNLRHRGASTAGNKALLVDRLASLLGADYVAPVVDAEAENRRRRAEELQHPEELFYDAPGYANSEPGAAQYVVDSLLAAIGPVSDWADLQSDDDCPERHRVVRADGLTLYDPLNGSGNLVVVPLPKRLPLLRLVHVELGHNVTSLLAEVKRAFWWPSMRKDVERFVASCEECKRNRSRINHQHGLWRHRAFFTPRTHYSMDIKKLGAGANVSYALVIIDRFSSYVTVSRISDKRTGSVIKALMTDIVWRFGAISELTIDSEKGFQSDAFMHWARMHDIRVVQPLAYSPTGNSSGEIFWSHFRLAYSDSGSPFPGDQERDNEICFAWNCQVKASTGFSPFMIQHGSAATTAAVQLARGLSSAVEPSAQQKSQLCRDMSVATAAITRIAAAQGNHRRRLTAIANNRKSRIRLKPLNVGQRVFAFQPPSGAVVDARGGGRNRAFVAPFIGPATVVTRLSNVGYELQSDDGKKFHRHRKHLRLETPWLTDPVA